MKPRLLNCLTICLFLAACSPVKDGALGRLHRYDANEYVLTVGLLHSARNIGSHCSQPEHALRLFQDLENKVDFFVTYTEGRPYNKRTTTLATDLRSMVVDTRNRSSMSEFFCQERSKNIVKAAEILRSAAGEKPE